METLKDLYFDQIKDLYDAEQRLVDTLPKLADAADSEELQEAFVNHLEETKNQVARLEKIFSLHGMKPEKETCKAMKGLIAEGEHELKKWKDPSVKDAALIASAQRVEHYEMAGYGSARAYAQCLGFQEDVRLLEETLSEEKGADAKLNAIATQGINQEALLQEAGRVELGGRSNQVRF
jgi:ferritin-like metal-binding protein YciE